jgi:ribose transport system permease protein
VKKLLGITLFLILVYVALMISHKGARTVATHRFLAERLGRNGILSVAVGMLIVTGGIDLSIGSLVALCSTVFGLLVVNYQWRVDQALLVMLLLAASVGLLNGLIVTKLRLQPFMVTLCGLFIFRSLARWLAKDAPVDGLSNRLKDVAEFYNGDILGIPVYLVFFAVLVLTASIFLHFSVYGRYYFALGSNERAARFAGIAVDSYKVSAYVACSLLTGVYSYLNLMKMPSVEPAQIGQNDELMAIAAAVLGGCTLRGGEGTVCGMVVGTMIILILLMMNTFWRIPNSVEGMLIGFILLLGIILDEVLRWRSGVGRVEKR